MKCGKPENFRVFYFGTFLKISSSDQINKLLFSPFHQHEEIPRH